jgi:hypothetical protein
VPADESALTAISPISPWGSARSSDQRRIGSSLTAMMHTRMSLIGRPTQMPNP